MQQAGAGGREEFLITSAGSLEQDKDPGHRGTTAKETCQARKALRLGSAHQGWFSGEETKQRGVSCKKKQKQKTNRKTQPCVPTTNPSLRKMCFSAASAPPFPVQTMLGHN